MTSSRDGATAACGKPPFASLTSFLHCPQPFSPPAVFLAYSVHSPALALTHLSSLLFSVCCLPFILSALSLCSSLSPFVSYFYSLFSIFSACALLLPLMMHPSPQSSISPLSSPHISPSRPLGSSSSSSVCFCSSVSRRFSLRCHPPT